MSKLRIALDSETARHTLLKSSQTDLRSDQLLDRTQSIPTPNLDSIRSTSSDTSLLLQTKGPTSEPTPVKKSTEDVARKAFLVGESDERVQALSIIMLYLCTGLQHAQDIATQ